MSPSGLSQCAIVREMGIKASSGDYAGAALLQAELEALKRTAGVEHTHLVDSKRTAIEKDTALKAASKDYAGAALLQAELTKLGTANEAEFQPLDSGRARLQ